MAVKRNNDRTLPQATVGIHSAAARVAPISCSPSSRPRLIAPHLFSPGSAGIQTIHEEKLEECSNGDQSCEQVAWMGQGVGGTLWVH